jgi:hypothetical protein
VHISHTLSNVTSRILLQKNLPKLLIFIENIVWSEDCPLMKKEKFYPVFLLYKSTNAKRQGSVWILFWTDFKYALALFLFSFFLSFENVFKVRMRKSLKVEESENRWFLMNYKIWCAQGNILLKYTESKIVC